MKPMLFSLFAALFAAMSTYVRAGESVSSVTPVQKVIQLLADMEAKSKSMKNAEAVEFSKFSQFCTDTKANKAKEIAEANELIESLTADIAKLASDISELGVKLDELHKGVADDEASLKEAKSQREKDHASYTEQITDFSESVDALERAISTLKKQSYDRKQASAALLQLASSDALPETVQRTVAAFVEMNTGEGNLLPSSPEANAYEFQSGSIVDLLEKLLTEFSDKKTESEKEEMNSLHAYQMVSQDLHDSIENAKADITEKTEIKQGKIQLKAEKTKALTTTTAGRDEDVSYLSDLKTECFEKEESFKEKQQLRTEEIAAIHQAIGILKSPEVSGNAKEYLPAASALMQNLAGTSLAQLRASRQEPDNRLRASQYLHTAGRRLHSRRLGMLAEKVSSVADPFGKVKKMIDDMITKLLEEANQESEQKGFCDKELRTNGQTRTKLQATIDELTAKIDENDALITSNAQRISTLSKELMELEKAMKESTALRTEEKAKNKETVSDAKEAQKAVEAATAVLKDFYAKAGEATALVQVDEQKRPTMGSPEWDSLANPNFEGTIDKGHKEGMQTFGKKYTGQQDEAGGVLAMLEVIMSDFATLEADTTASEAESAKAYKDFMVESEKSVAVKTKESEMLTNDNLEAKSEVTADTKDLKATQDQLLAAERYYDKLKPTCVDSGVSYKDRVKAREEEIESLKEALRILEGA